MPADPLGTHGAHVTAAEIEHDRREAERCKYQRGTQGVWARRWLALYAWAQDNAEIVARLEANG